MSEETRLSASLSQLDKIEKLKGTSNFLTWKQDFEDVLKMLDLWHYIATDNTILIVAKLITETHRSA